MVRIYAESCTFVLKNKQSVDLNYLFRETYKGFKACTTDRQNMKGCDKKKCRGLQIGNAVGINSYLTTDTESQLDHNHMVYMPTKHDTVNEEFYLYINIYLCKVMLQNDARKPPVYG